MTSLACILPTPSTSRQVDANGHHLMTGSLSRLTNRNGTSVTWSPGLMQAYGKHNPKTVVAHGDSPTQPQPMHAALHAPLHCIVPLTTHPGTHPPSAPAQLPLPHHPLLPRCFAVMLPAHTLNCMISRAARSMSSRRLRRLSRCRATSSFSFSNRRSCSSSLPAGSNTAAAAARQPVR